MSKFFGKVGYVITEETDPGDWESRISEIEYYGELLKNTTSRFTSGVSINDNITISNVVSIIADSFAYEHFHSIKYVELMGVKWKVSNVEIQHPRLILTLGEVYN